MSTLTIAYGRPTLADRIFSRGLVTDLILIAAGTALTSVLAQIAIPLWPVPITGQTFAVLFVGATLGVIRAAAVDGALPRPRARRTARVRARRRTAATSPGLPRCSARQAGTWSVSSSPQRSSDGSPSASGTAVGFAPSSHSLSAPS